ncbi:uncharacterized protein SCHCODRAFT_02348576 [Schizophyllum commune H4-8]|uniref:uncharacterized protein n=1 Tax=Schizophyllum commune (strain H4-8 / FGSC 9210) TaxID=578458 RepID=UPI00215EED10|nr:uncharacterized protein SCHCODRAFT_02348576 [Schizophyllum commune H4-8]KAI5890594.1 hypothetical protein SCHCODRAFT_02348576 [Schizophyllum commune H4-8]
MVERQRRWGAHLRSAPLDLALTAFSARIKRVMARFRSAYSVIPDCVWSMGVARHDPLLTNCAYHPLPPFFPLTPSARYLAVAIVLGAGDNSP